jgi:hypothetical protein
VFAGKLEEDRAQIAGEFGGTPLRFSHAAAAGCEGAQPPP